MLNKPLKYILLIAVILTSFMIGRLSTPTPAQSGPCLLEAKVDNMAFVYCPGTYRIRIGGLELRDLKFGNVSLVNDRHGAKQVIIRVDRK
ncbi:hypothetical protein [Desulfovibrio sp. JC010]|uniref:hypothetical protein n=1 Tax=Desulfovibrio sp. JC010 TaxID=2593641 RepID=UPI0013D171CA|nr:hypothetical protein [Desulfovibrio sp. JC010]NDV26049.1 hypothetical protein [Desulfovibrio sp. JC010]